jgi:putative endonuclease
MKKGYMYILECYDGSFYTGSTIDLDERMRQHQKGRGANHTKKRLPVKLIYYEEFNSISKAFYREKQIQGWSRDKKIALIERNFKDLSKLAECQNESHHKWFRLRSTTQSDINE